MLPQRFELASAIGDWRFAWYGCRRLVSPIVRDAIGAGLRLVERGEVIAGRTLYDRFQAPLHSEYASAQ